MHSDLRF